MKTLDLYILRQLLVITLLGVAALTLLMLLGQLFKELHTLLVETGAPPSIVIDFILRVIPFSLTFSVPWGFLTAVLLVYGRMAADNELTSMRMAGLSLWRLSAPAIGFGLALSALCYYINIDVAPRGKQAMSDIVLNAAMDNPRNLLKSSQSATKLDKFQIYIEERSGNTLHGLHLYPLTEDDGLATGGVGFNSIHAERADIGEFDTGDRILQLTLRNATIESTKNGVTDLAMLGRMPLNIHIPLQARRKLKPNRYTNDEIAEVLRHMEISRGISHKRLKRYGRAAAKNHTMPCANKLWSAALEDTAYNDTAMDKKVERAFRTEGTQRASFSCACIVFSLIGVPLAITARRRDTSTGFAIGILVAAVYFLALVLCELSRKCGGITPYLVLWLPNILCTIFALWQHRKAQFRG